MLKRKSTLKILLLLGILGILILIFVQGGEPMQPTGLQPKDVPYSLRGPYHVGLHEAEIDAETPLKLTVWYPALNEDDQKEKITYPYKIKIGKPIGNVSIASSNGQAIRNAAQDLSASPYPLVVLSPGFSIGSMAYAWLAEHLASYGFVVVSPDHNENLDPENLLWQTAITRPQDILTVFDYIDRQTSPDGDFAQLIDPETVAVIGHSYGGYTALAAAGAQFDTEGFRTQCEGTIADEAPGAWLCEMLLPHMADMADLAGLDVVPDGLWPAQADTRVDAIVPMAGDAFFFGQDGLAQISVPVMAIGGTADEDSPYMMSTYPAYEYAASQRKVRIALTGAEHMVFSGPCESIPLYTKPLSGEFCSDTSWNRLRAHDLTKHFATAFLLAELNQDSDAAAALAVDKVDFSDATYDVTGY